MGAPRKPYLDEAAKLYEAGESVGALAEHYGVSRTSMWMSIRRRVPKLRPQLRFGKDNHFFRGGRRAVDRVHNITERAIESGLLVRKARCEKCGDHGVMADGRSRIQAHHDDYNKPLEVRWLCQECHHAWHKKNRAVPFKGAACG